MTMVEVRDRITQEAGLPEITRTPGDRYHFSCRAEVVIHLHDSIGKDPEFVIPDGSGPCAGQIEIGMMGEAQGRGLVGTSFGFDDEFIGFR